MKIFFSIIFFTFNLYAFSVGDVVGEALDAIGDAIDKLSATTKSVVKVSDADNTYFNPQAKVIYETFGSKDTKILTYDSLVSCTLMFQVSLGVMDQVCAHRVAPGEFGNDYPDEMLCAYRKSSIDIGLDTLKDTLGTVISKVPIAGGAYNYDFGSSMLVMGSDNLPRADKELLVPLREKMFPNDFDIGEKIGCVEIPIAPAPPLFCPVINADTSVKFNIGVEKTPIFGEDINRYRPQSQIGYSSFENPKIRVALTNTETEELYDHVDLTMDGSNNCASFADGKVFCGEFKEEYAKPICAYQVIDGERIKVGCVEKPVMTKPEIISHQFNNDGSAEFQVSFNENSVISKKLVYKGYNIKRSDFSSNEKYREEYLKRYIKDACTEYEGQEFCLVPERRCVDYERTNKVIDEINGQKIYQYQCKEDEINICLSGWNIQQNTLLFVLAHNLKQDADDKLLVTNPIYNGSPNSYDQENGVYYYDSSKDQNDVLVSSAATVLRPQSLYDLGMCKSPSDKYIYSNPGEYEVTMPSYCSEVEVRMYGAGAAGKANKVPCNYSGGAGGYLNFTLEFENENRNIRFLVGQGGTQNGENGMDSSFYYLGEQIAIAKGGAANIGGNVTIQSSPILNSLKSQSGGDGRICKAIGFNGGISAENDVGSYAYKNNFTNYSGCAEQTDFRTPIPGSGGCASKRNYGLGGNGYVDFKCIR